jgi:hypothetical protein
VIGHPLEGLGVEEAAGVVGERRVDRHVVGAVEQFLEGDEVGLVIRHVGWREERVGGEHVGAEGRGA